jgi:hypothetical protein
VRIADGRPGDECQIDFGRMASLHDPAAERTRVAYILVFTACLSRALLRVGQLRPDHRGGHRRL